MEGEVAFRVPGVDQVVKTYYKVFGDISATSATRRPLVALHGGPGVVHNYLLPLADLAKKHSIPVVLYDQLGNGKSTHLPNKTGDTAFWTDDLFITQLKSLLEHLGIQDSFDLFGHSWGGMLAARFATTHPAGLKRLIIANSPASMELWVEAANKLRSALPQDVQDTLNKHEAAGTTDSKEYHDAVSVFYARHVCRLDPMPSDLVETFATIEQDPTVYMTMYVARSITICHYPVLACFHVQDLTLPFPLCLCGYRNGPSEFHITGSLKTWSILDSISEIKVPTLLLNGRYDEAQDSVLAPYFRGLDKVKWFTFAESSHTPQYEERELFIERVGDFLTAE
ncbi:proline-specific peptidase [Pilatotrama ljubarskyi]|nr:proline-specific peptidase [Pilatotrama ljubarskyi]